MINSHEKGCIAKRYIRYRYKSLPVQLWICLEPEQKFNLLPERSVSYTVPGYHFELEVTPNQM